MNKRTMIIKKNCGEKMSEYEFIMCDGELANIFLATIHSGLQGYRKSA